MSDETRNYWWLNANPVIWDFSEFAPGEENDYTQFNENGSPRQIQKFFSQVRPGDWVLGYSTSPKKQLSCLCKITQSLENGVFHFAKVLDFPNPVPSSDWTDDPVLKYFHFQGSLFKLSQEQWDRFVSLVKERNPDMTIPADEAKMGVRPRIWKISHGSHEFNSAPEILRYLEDNQLVTMHRLTRKGQGAKFVSDMQIGDFFYLRENGKIKLFGRVESNADITVGLADARFGDAAGSWRGRKYSIVFKPVSTQAYSGVQRAWTPNYNSTLAQVPPGELADFEKLILLPFFGKRLQDIPGMAISQSKTAASLRAKTLRVLFAEMQSPDYSKWLHEWHDLYQQFCTRTYNATSIDDDLFHALLWERYNGVSVVGQSILTKNLYETLKASPRARISSATGGGK